MLKQNRFFIHLLMILALVNVLASPACAFISGGKTLWQICGNESIDQEETFSIDPKVAALIVTSQDNTQQPEHNAKPECQFCFSQSHTVKNLQLILNAKAPEFQEAARPHFWQIHASLKSDTQNAYLSRAPPAVS